MKLLYEGKTKDVFELEDGNILLKFKNTITGHADGTVDPGGNLVVGEEAGLAEATVAMSVYYFNILKKAGLPTHFVSRDKADEMIVRKAEPIGKGLEFIRRYKATGSLMRRFGDFFEEGQPIDITELTIKDDAKDDPPITYEILIEAGLLDFSDVSEIINLFKSATDHIHDNLADKRLKLWDIKLEIGRIQINGQSRWAIIDEISPGNMRVYQDDKKLDKQELVRLVLPGR